MLSLYGDSFATFGSNRACMTVIVVFLYLSTHDFLSIGIVVVLSMKTWSGTSIVRFFGKS